MRFAVCLTISTMVLTGCTDAEERFLEEQLDKIDEPQTGTILLALIRADGSINAAHKGGGTLGPDDPIRIAKGVHGRSGSDAG